MSREEIWQLLALVGAPVVAALIGGVSAVVKRSWGYRDEQRQAQQLVDQAARRVEFVTSWLDAHEKLGDEVAGEGEPAKTQATRRAEVNRTAEMELAAAYETLREATLLAGPRRAVAPWHRVVFQKLQSILLLAEHQRSHYLLVGLFYVLTIFMWMGLIFEGEPESDPDYTSLSEDIALSIVYTLVFRVVFGLLIAWRNRNERSSNDQDARDATQLDATAA